MDKRVAALLEAAIADERRGRLSSSSATVLNLLTWLRAERRGRNDVEIAEFTRQTVGFDVTSVVAQRDVPEIVRRAFDELRDEPAALPWLLAIVCEPEDARFGPLIVDLLRRLWDDRRVNLATLPIVTLEILGDDFPDGKRELQRWADRDDAAGVAAREALGG